MLQFKVELAATGPLTQIPDSQKLFGALVYLFAEHHGEEQTTTLTKAVLDKRVHLALSDVMPSGYLPTPQDWLIKQLSQKTGIDLKKMHKEVKRRSYIKPQQLREFQQKGANEQCFPFVQLQIGQQPRASLESVQYQMPELEPKLYSVPTVYVTETIRHEGKETNRPVKQFCFYLETSNSDLSQALLQMIEKMIRERRSVILGKRASQGLNTFLFTKAEQFEINHPADGQYLNIGMLLPDRINLKNSILRLFTSERRPYEMVGGWNARTDRWFISFIAPGSVIYAPEGPKAAGRCVVSPFRKNRDIVFGNAFLYPWEGLEKGCGNG